MKRLLLIILILSLSRQNFFAQTPHFRNYTVDDGLPSSHVYRAFQDSKGFIWFCTDKGIARFDGYKFEKFTTKNGLPNNDVWQCAEDSEQRIWFLSYANAFFYFDLKDNKFHVIENPYKEYHDSHVWAFVHEGNNKIKVFLSVTCDLLLIDLKQNKVISKEYVEGKNCHTNTYPLINGISTLQEIKSNHIEKSSNSSFVIRVFSEGLQHNLLHKKHNLPNIDMIPKIFWSKCISMIYEDNKTIYGNSDSISFYRNNRFYTKAFDELTKYSNDNLSLILSTGSINRKLILTDKDSFIIDENINRIQEFDFIKKFNINTVFFDRENNMWLCTKDKGLFLLSQKAIYSKLFDELINSSISTIVKDKFDRIWFGTTTGKVYYINKNEEIKKQEFSYSPNIAIRNIIFSSKDMIIGWNNSSFAIIPIYKLAKTSPVALEDKYINFTIKNIYSKTPNKYYVLKNFGLKTAEIIDEKHILISSFNNLKILENFPDRFIFRKKIKVSIKSLALLAVSNKEVFVGANKGLFKLENLNFLEPLTKLKQKYPILTTPISSFAKDRENALWIGTDGYGIYRFYKNQATEISEVRGMIINHLYLEEENNYLWLATNEGVFLLKLDLKTSSFKYSIQKISLAQGLPTLEVNCMVARNDNLFIGTSKGLVMLPIQRIIEAQKQTIPIPLIIKNIKINRQDTTVLYNYELNYRQNNIDIEFVALSYKSDRNIKYDYKMVGSANNSDTLWHSVQDLHKEFSLLSPDIYKFSLRAFDINGNATQSVKPIIFIINPPFWDTNWFKILSFFLILFLIIFYFFLRTRNIQKKEQEKTEINKRFAELELQALQAQMNPHFVFNALSAIQNFILNNNAEEATDYLSRFSRLMRLFLESSRNKYIALSEEKTLLEYYIQLEQLRFKDKFTYQIILGEGVSLDTEIPSLLLQPFVENAINHGLVYKNTDDGYLNINFKKENNKLICVIEDNGIGRNEAAAIKNKSLKPYKSRSTEITEERLRSLELIENTKIEIDIFDKIDENFIPQGTKVTIVMYL